jgi:hypothetical protein
VGLLNTPSFRLPDAGQQEIIRVRLTDGTIVERAPDQLMRLPASLNVPVEAFAPPPRREDA